MAVGKLFLGVVTIVGGAVTPCHDVGAQTFPGKLIRIVTGGSGSNGDFASRLLAQGLTQSLGQQVIVENRPSGIILGEVVAKAPPDGHTLLVTGSSFWLAPFLQDNVPWDPVRDFAPITLAASSPNLVVVHPSLPVKSMRELIVLAKARPGELNYASGTTGSMPHLAAELFKQMAKVNIVRINYKGIGLALTDTIGGQMQLMFPNAGGAAPHVKSGRLRALAVTTAQPTPLFPGIPTVAGAGLAGYEVATINGIFAPARTPPAIIERLQTEFAKQLSLPDIREKFLATGVETIGSRPEGLAAAVKGEMTLFGKLIRDAGVRAD
jgi:tripartite-type tricarboxylate transporter receptor subunit TctC